MSQISFFTELLWLNVQSLKWNKPLMWESRWVSAGQTLAMLGFQNFSFNTSLLSHHRLSYSSSHIQKSAWKPCTVFPQVESRAILISPQTTPPGFISFFISSFFSYNLYKDLLRWFFEYSTLIFLNSTFDICCHKEATNSKTFGTGGTAPFYLLHCLSNWFILNYHQFISIL